MRATGFYEFYTDFKDTNIFKKAVKGDGTSLWTALSKAYFTGVQNGLEKNPVTIPLLPEELIEPLLQFFKYDHLPVDLQNVSRPFFRIATDLIAKLPDNVERTNALRRLLESKDSAVRSKIFEGKTDENG